MNGNEKYCQIIKDYTFATLFFIFFNSVDIICLFMKSNFLDIVTIRYIVRRHMSRKRRDLEFICGRQRRRGQRYIVDFAIG